MSASPHTADLFAKLDAEMSFAKRLEQHGYHVFLGSTTTAERRERIRQAILDTGKDVVIFGRGPNGKPETYKAAFERLFNLPLDKKPLKGKCSC